MSTPMNRETLYYSSDTKSPSTPMDYPESTLSAATSSPYQMVSLDGIVPNMNHVSPRVMTSTPCKANSSTSQPSSMDLSLDNGSSTLDGLAVKDGERHTPSACRQMRCTSPTSITSSFSQQHVQLPLLYSPGSSNSANRNTSVLSNTSVFCRICHEGAHQEDLVSPCRCTGTMGKIHVTCAERWLSSANKSRCEICDTEYITKREAKPLIDWLKMPENPADKRNVIGDVICFLILTPLAVISDWLCVNGALHYSNTPETPRWQITGLIILAVCLALIYFTWCFVAIRYHRKVFLSWQMKNQIVKFVDTGHCSSPTRGQGVPHNCSANLSSTHSAATDSSIDTNNNELSPYSGTASAAIATSMSSPESLTPLYRYRCSVPTYRVTMPTYQVTEETSGSIVVNLFPGSPEEAMASPFQEDGGGTRHKVVEPPSDVSTSRTMMTTTTTVCIVRETMV